MRFSLSSGTAVAATGLVLLIIGPLGLAEAQPSAVGYVGRPSDGASTRVGALGGQNTRQATVNPFGGQGRGNARVDPNAFQTRRLGGGGAPRVNLPMDTLPVNVGVRVRYPGGGRMGYRNVGINVDVLRRISGLRRATSMDITPEAAQQLNQRPLLRTPIYAPLESPDGFHRWFGLVPAQQQEALFSDVDDEEPFDWADAIRAQNDQQVASDRKLALAAFATATNGRVLRDRLSDVLKADSVLRIWRRSEREDAVPALLAAHIALEREQLTAAAGFLGQAVRRDPAIFLDGPEIASYFGDYDEETGRSPTLDRQFRRYSTAGELNEKSPMAQLVTAYASFAAGDERRAEAALARLDELAMESQQREELERFGWALAAALRD